MASEPSEMRDPRSEEKARRVLARFGCGPEALQLILAHLERSSPTRDARLQRLGELAQFAKAIGPAASRDYFRAVEVTGAVAKLTDPTVLAFARSVDRHTAEWYFWAIWGTKSVAELTSARVLQAVEFFQVIDSFATVEYFLAIRETKDAARLTSDRVLDFAEHIGSEAAVEFFGAFWETRGAAELTEERTLSFAERLGGAAAKEYFSAIRETREVGLLLSEPVRAFGQAVGKRVSEEYFRAIRTTRAARELTDPNVLVFAEIVGKGPAKQYFSVLASTKAVAELTDPRVLEMSGVVRAIGSDAALDYFAAIASGRTPAVPPVGPDGTRGSSTTPSVPVLTLLDIPTYSGYRTLGLAAMTGAFWWFVAQLSGSSLLRGQDVLALALALGAWIGLLCGAYVLLGSVIERAQGQFVDRRRRLLNEHGIRWHDCLSGEQWCPLCWSSVHTHEDGRYDYGRFCRCPAC